MKSSREAWAEFGEAKAEFKRALLASPLGRFITWILDRLTKLLESD